MPNQNKNKKKNKEPTDEELLAEIEKEAHDAILNDTVEQNLNVDDLLNNDTIKNNENINIESNANNANNFENNANNANNVNYDGGAQLTTFQDNIITTGSDVSVLLMVILFILFLIQAVRKAYNYFTLQSKIKQVANPLDGAKPVSAENLTPINPGYDHKSYAVYNTAFEDRDLYLQKQKEGAPPSVLKDVLLRRAVKCIEKFSAIQRDGVGIRKNWNMDLLPKDVWADFNAAQRNIQCEIESVAKENAKYQFNWGQPHKHDIFAKGREIYGQKIDIQRKVFHQKQRLYHQQKQQQQRSSSNAPNAKTFGSGFNAGFFNSNSNKTKNKKLTNKEKKELKRQKKQMQQQQTPTMMQNNIENNNNLYQTQPHRRKKGKHRFSKGK